MSLDPGALLGPYEILSQIGAGGMGEVYKARDTRLDRIVAVKVSKTEFSERFEREARAIAGLNHPHICHLYDVGPNYLVMEYVEGEPIKGPLPVDKALEYAAQIAGALDMAHTNKATHRDLKPANLLVTKSAGVKLLDSGLAKLEKPVSVSDETFDRGLDGEGHHPGDIAAHVSGAGQWAGGQLSTAGGEQPRWRGDGKELFYVATDGKMTAVPVKAIVGAIPTFEPGAPMPLFNVNIARIIAAPTLFQYDVTADGKRFLIATTAEASASPLNVIVNWHALPVQNRDR